MQVGVGVGVVSALVPPSGSGSALSPSARCSLALGSVLSRPYYNPYYYPYGYYGYPPAPAHYPPAASYPYYPPPASAYPPGSSYTPQPTYTPQAGRSGGNIARQLNQQELNQLQAAPFNPPPPPYYPPPYY